MTFQYTPYTVPLIVGSVICVTYGVAAWRRRALTGAKNASFLMLAGAVWSLAYALQLSGVSLPEKIFWGKVKYFGILGATLNWFFFALIYTGKTHWLTRSRVALIIAFPVIILVLIWTNEYHGLMHRGFKLESDAGFMVRVVDHGPIFWVHTAYCYTLILIGSLLILKVVLTSRHLFLGQTVALLVASLTPWVGNVLYVAGLSPFGNVDLGPFAFIVTGLAITWATLRMRLLDLVPVARHAVLEKMRDGVIVLDGMDRIVDVNPAAGKILCRDEPDIIGRPMSSVTVDWKEFVLPESRNAPSVLELKLNRDERDYFYELQITPLFGSGERYLGRLFVLRDNTERIAAERALKKAYGELENRVQERTEELRRSEEKYRQLIENANDAVFILQDGMVRFFNKKTTEIMGYTEEEIRSIPFVEHIHRDDRAWVFDRHIRRLKGENFTSPYTFRLLNKAGELLWGEVNATIIEWEQHPAVLCFVRDITLQKKLEEQTQRAQKLESIGVLAGGIAHDFNNILSALMGNISMAKFDTRPDDPLYKLLDKAEQASERATALTRQLLTFSRGGAPVKKTVEVSKVIRDVTEFALSGSKSRCEYHIPNDLWPADIDVGQISQALQNLVINADQAAPEGGAIEIRARNETIESPSDLPLDPGRYVNILIKDRGMGIDEENLSKIFDPYFTTKSTGSGLGLAVTYSIIQKHEGHITVKSRRGEGASFKIYLPASPDRTPGKTEGEDMTSLIGQGRILVMDDEEAIRVMACDMLNRLGYRSESAENGTEAVERYGRAREAGEPFDAVILDLTVPGDIGGEEVVHVLRAIDSRLIAIVSSGYSGNPVLSDYRSYGFNGVVEKPYSFHKLGKTLKEALKERKY